MPVGSTSSTSSTSGSTSTSGVPAVEAVGEDHDPVVIGAELDLVLGEDHPLGDLAAELAPLERRARSGASPRQRDRDRRAGAEVPGAAHDLVPVGLAHVDLRELETVGVRMLDGLEHVTDAEQA